MPVKSLCRPLYALSALALLANIRPSSAESPYRYEASLTQAQLALPSHGPSSFWFNPAALAETHWASGAYGLVGSLTGKGGTSLLSGSGALPIEHFPWPIGLALGLARAGNPGARMDGSNAVYEEGDSRISAAVSFPPGPDRRFVVSTGAAWTITTYNAFNAVRTTTNGMDLGLYAAFSGGHGTFRVGTALHHFLRPEVALPNDNPGLIRGVYDVRAWWGKDLGWTSAERRWRADLGLFLMGPHDLAEGPDQEDGFGIAGWEAEFRPVPLVGLQLERPRFGSQSTVSLIAHPEFSSVRAFASIGFGHDKYDPEAILPFGKVSRALFGEARDEGRGVLLVVSLGAEI